MLHGVQIHISDYHAVESARVLGALIAELAELAPDENLFADYLREDGSPSGFLKALGQREIAEALARNEVPPALLNPDSEAFRAFLQRREGYLVYE
jgi:hypothetical protein